MSNVSKILDDYHKKRKGLETELGRLGDHCVKKSTELTAAVIDELNFPVAVSYKYHIVLNEKLEGAKKSMYQLNSQLLKWREEFAKLRTSTKTLGDIETWSQALETETGQL